MNIVGIDIGGTFTALEFPTGGALAVDGTTAAPVLLPKVLGTVFTIVPDGTGGWYLGGLFTYVGGQPRANLARIQSDGTVLPWNPGADANVYAIAASGGLVYVGGAFTTIGGQSRNRIAAVDASTGAVTAWNPGADGDVRTLVVSGGTVYAGGVFTNAGGSARNFLAALDATTGLATAWNPNPNVTVRAMVLSGTTLYFGGLFTTVGGVGRNRLAAVDASSGALLAWNPNANSTVNAMLLSGTTIYLGGLFTTVGAPQIRRRRLWASFKSCCPAANELAMGFSLQMCLPASSACRLSRSCSCISVRLTRRSKAAPANILSMCG